MTDQELIEAAAKAANLPNMRIEADGAVLYSYAPENGFVFWNPLTDDGDALRLAVKLRMAVSFGFHGTEIEAQKKGGTFMYYETELNDESARRALVRAAAAL